MALDAVFAADLRKINPEVLLAASAEEQLDRQNQEEIVGYARQIVEGVAANFAEIDDRIEAFSHKWSVERMPAVDRAILRVACWEILFNEEVPDGRRAFNRGFQYFREWFTGRNCWHKNRSMM